MNLTLKQYIDGVDAGKFSPQEIAKSYLDKAKQENLKYNAFVRFHEEYVQKNINVFATKKLRGAPIAIKDIVMTK